MTKISAHFTLSELTRSGTAQKRGLDNTPDEAAKAALTALCENILEPVRVELGKPMRVNSAYRAPDVNAAVGGSKTSQHCKGEAIDVEIDGMPNIELAQKIIDMGLPFDQLILEFYTPGEPNSGWVHVSHKHNGEQRGQVLTAARIDGKTVYSEGLNA